MVVRNSNLFEILPKEVIVQAVQKAFEKLNNGRFGNCSIRDISVSKQVICGLFHELIVHEIADYQGWRIGKQKKEADLMHDTGLHLQVKTSSSIDGIAGNRYSSLNEYASASEFYICVNFLPFDSICRIRAGYVDATAWNPQRGKGNAATLDKHYLSEMPLLLGEYTRQMNIAAIPGFGSKAIKRMNELGIYKVGDFESFSLEDILGSKKKNEVKKLLAE